MAMALLGETLDLHAGGVDLLFPHHEDEIAQSEAATGKTFARHWCHGEFLLTDGSKMAKRVGNVATVEDLQTQKVSPAAVRHFFFTTHYRKQLNLSREALDASSEAVRRSGDFAERLAAARGAPAGLTAIASAASAEFRAGLFDDLNAPEALAAMFTFIKRANAELDRGGADTSALERARSAFREMDSVLDLVPTEPVADVSLSSWVEEQLAARRAARNARQFEAADRIRKEVESRGVVIEDGASGTKWRLKDQRP
jgi:cysteinyl-tRNA synthetase